jgi:hypothetical protein
MKKLPHLIGGHLTVKDSEFIDFEMESGSGVLTLRYNQTADKEKNE